MRFIDDEEIDRPGCERVDKLGLRELFRRGEDKLDPPIVDGNRRALGFGGRHRAVHLHGTDPERGELVPLILHQRNQWAHHDRRAWKQESRKLVAEGFAAPVGMTANV